MGACSKPLKQKTFVKQKVSTTKSRCVHPPAVHFGHSQTVAATAASGAGSGVAIGVIFLFYPPVWTRE